MKERRKERERARKRTGAVVSIRHGGVDRYTTLRPIEGLAQRDASRLWPSLATEREDRLIILCTTVTMTTCLGNMVYCFDTEGGREGGIDGWMDE